MSDPTYPLFPIFAFLGFLLSLIPLPWHLQAWNSGTCFYMIWTSLACLNQFINSIVWSGNALNPAPIWCEISIRITMAASVGIPASSLCIVRRLYKIASVQVATVTRAEKRRAVIVDSAICGLFPLIYIPLQYVVQGHRFNIFEDIGCAAAVYNTLLTYFTTMMWPLVLGLLSAIYCVLALWEFRKRQMQFNQFLSSHNSLTVSRYFRLMALAMVEMCCTTPLTIFVIVLNATSSPIGPWRSWSDTHLDYSRVEQIPALFWRSNRLLVISLELNRWILPLCAIIFFAFFGFAQEARKNYRTYFSAIAKCLHLPRGLATPPFRSYQDGKPRILASAGSLPLYTVTISEKHGKSVSSLATHGPSPDDVPISIEHLPSNNSFYASPSLSSTPSSSHLSHYEMHLTHDTPSHSSS